MSGFAYINPTQAMLEMTLEAFGGTGSFMNLESRSQGAGADAPVITCELDESWKNFEKELGVFKRELAKVRRDMNQQCTRLAEIQRSTEISKIIMDKIPSEDLKMRIASVLDNYESDEGVDTLTQQCGVLKGKFEAMNKVLEGTQAERYDKFTCFVCMERLVDLCMNPCGHVMCEHCWSNTRDKTACPGCRQHIISACKIFTM